MRVTSKYGNRFKLLIRFIDRPLGTRQGTAKKGDNEDGIERRMARCCDRTHRVRESRSPNFFADRSFDGNLDPNWNVSVFEDRGYPADLNIGCHL